MINYVFASWLEPYVGVCWILSTINHNETLFELL